MTYHQPKDATGIRVDKILEKTASAGITLADIFKVTTTKLQALNANLDIGDATTSIKNLFVNIIKNSTSTLTLTDKLVARLGHSGYTTGGDLTIFTKGISTSSTTPTELFSYAIPNTNTSVSAKLCLVSRDSTSNSYAYQEYVCSAKREAGAATGETQTTIATSGTALIAVTAAVSGNNLVVNIANASGTNTIYSSCKVEVLGVSTAT